jgi:23S rRNA pseudouridine1911/1915/1917 synthase
MAGLQKRGSIPEALPLPSSRSMNAEFQVIELEIPQELAGQRLDSALARLLPEHSRTRIKAWIEAGQVQVGRLPSKPRDKVESGNRIRLTISAPAPDGEVLPEAIALDVVFEDAEVMVIDKPAGLVVHPGAGNRRHTLQNALLAKDPALAALPRAGIVHRLDKDTSGLLMIARTPQAQTALSRQLLARSVAREYLAICVGMMTGGGTVDEPIGRHRSNRLRMAIRGDGRPARTHYRVLERFRGHSYLKVKLDTGRTHQIRVHLAHLKYPLVGDPVYGSRLAYPRGAGMTLIDALRGFKRQALHAAALAFDHPVSGARLSFAAPLPPDFAGLLAALRADVRGGAGTPRSVGV